MKRYLLLIGLVATQIAKAQVTSFDIDSSKFLKPVMAKLDSIYLDDQSPRRKFEVAVQRKEQKFKIDSLRNYMHQKDRENIAKVTAIIDQYGWLGPQKVGFSASQALFLVIQHADLATQKRYLPLIRAAEKKGEILSSNLALLEDRINMHEGKKQVFGSQCFTDKQTGRAYIYPIVDPGHLDERRKSVGLQPMRDYAAAMHINWDLEAYKKMLPEIEKIAAQQKLQH